jgi:hypothetical protein
MTYEEFMQAVKDCEWQRHIEFHTVTGEHASNPDTCRFCVDLIRSPLRTEYCCPECAAQSGRIWPEDYK